MVAKPEHAVDTRIVAVENSFWKTGWPIPWLIMKFLEADKIFDPDRVYIDSERGPTLKKPQEYGLNGFSERELHLDTGEMVTSWYKPAREGFPTIVYCHGSAGGLETRKAELTEFAERGFGVMIAAYPGFKGHKLHPKAIKASEKACNQTGLAMVRELAIRHDVPVEKIVLFGESMGGSVALNTTYQLEQGDTLNSKYQFDRGIIAGHEPQTIGAVVTWGAFYNLVKRGKQKYPRVPLDYLMDNYFNSSEHIAEIKAPVLLMHGTADEVTTYDHSELLRDASGGKAKLDLFENVNHSVTLGSPGSFALQVGELGDRIASDDAYKDHQTTTYYAIRSLIPDYNGPANPFESKDFIKSLQGIYADQPNPYDAFLTAAQSKVAIANHPLKMEKSHAEEPDMVNLKKIVDHMQQFLADRGLCPPLEKPIDMSKHYVASNHEASRTAPKGSIPALDR